MNYLLIFLVSFMDPPEDKLIFFIISFRSWDYNLTRMQLFKSQKKEDAHRFINYNLKSIQFATFVQILDEEKCMQPNTQLPRIIFGSK